MLVLTLVTLHQSKVTASLDALVCEALATKFGSLLVSLASSSEVFVAVRGSKLAAELKVGCSLGGSARHDFNRRFWTFATG